VQLVENADAGCFHRELEALLRIRVHNTLLELIEQQRLGRDVVDGEYLYLNADVSRAAAQVARRRHLVEPESALPLELTQVVDVLVAVIQAPEDDAPAIAARLKARGLEISAKQIEAVFTRYGVVKKAVRSPSRRSRRGEAPSAGCNTSAGRRFRTPPAPSSLPPTQRAIAPSAPGQRGSKRLSVTTG